MAKRPGHLWAIVQAWMDSIPYPPSQNKLAVRLGVSASSLGDYKYAEHMPGPEFLERLAAEVRVPYETVLDAMLKDFGYRPAQRAEDYAPAARNDRPEADRAVIDSIAKDAVAYHVEQRTAAKKGTSAGRRSRLQQDQDAEAGGA